MVELFFALPPMLAVRRVSLIDACVVAEAGSALREHTFLCWPRNKGKRSEGAQGGASNRKFTLHHDAPQRPRFPKVPSYPRPYESANSILRTDFRRGRANKERALAARGRSVPNAHRIELVLMGPMVDVVRQLGL